jgi:3-oxoacyl-[acyl-carrier protein] reductase
MVRPALEGKFALVTGASSGIGAATVRWLAQAGATVCIGYHQGLDRAEALRAGLPGNGHLIGHLTLDMPDTIAALASVVERAAGKLDVLVNSAGFTQPISHKDLDRLDEALFDKILINNARGPYSVMRRFMPLLKRSGDAVVVNVSSISAFTGSGSNIAYCAAKAALDTMTMSFARAFGPEVRFLCVSPAQVATDFVAGRDRRALDEAAQATPLKRVTEPEDVAEAIGACITHLRSATGTTIVIDGGRHL